jgi:Rrf2 family protein
MPANTRFVTAVQVLVNLAQTDGFKTSEELGEMIGAHPIVVRRIIARLGHARVIKTRRGFRHGSQMIRSPFSITLGEIYRALKLRDEFFSGAATGRALSRLNVVLAEIHTDCQDAFETELDHVTLASVMKMANYNGDDPRPLDLHVH